MDEMLRETYEMHCFSLLASSVYWNIQHANDFANEFKHFSDDFRCLKVMMMVSYKHRETTRKERVRESMSLAYR